jgi:hypothetical protein
MFPLAHEYKCTDKYAENDQKCSFEVGLPGVSIFELRWKNYYKFFARRMCVVIDWEIILTPKGIVFY